MFLQYELNAYDYLDLNLHHLRADRELHRRLLWNRMLATGIVLAIGLMCLAMTNANDSWSVGLVAGVTMAMFLSTPVFVESAVRRQVEAACRQGIYRRQLQTVSVTREGLDVATCTDCTGYAFQNMVRIDDAGQAFYIYLKSGRVIIVPQRAFYSVASSNSFYQTVRAHIPH